MAAKKLLPTISLGKGKGKTQARGKGRLKGRMPTKRSINLVTVGEKKISIPKAVIGTVLIIGLAVLFSKFLVVDRLNSVNRAEATVAQKREELYRFSEALGSYTGVEDAYAHYTLEGMTQEELGLGNRPKILALVGKVCPEKDAPLSWSLSGNVLTIEASRDTLDELNKLAKKLEKSDYVDTCTITMANKKEVTSRDKTVTEIKVRGTFTVYLQQPPEVEEEEAIKKDSNMVESIETIVDNVDNNEEGAIETESEGTT